MLHVYTYVLIRKCTRNHLDTVVSPEATSQPECRLGQFGMQERKKKLAVEEAWKMQYNKEERKKRYRDQGKAEALAEKRQKRD